MKKKTIQLLSLTQTKPNLHEAEKKAMNNYKLKQDDRLELMCNGKNETNAKTPTKITQKKLNNETKLQKIANCALLT